MKFELPFLPISVNQCFYTDFKSRTRHISADYRRFKKDCAPFMAGKRISGEIAIEYNFFYPFYFKNGNRRKIDMLNFEKSLTDTLVYFGVIDDDSLIRKMTLENYDSENKETVVEIKSMV